MDNIYWILLKLFLSLLTLLIIFTYWQRKKLFKVKKESIKVMAICGSGGHTTEMIRLINHLPSKFHPINYIVADTDNLSVKKIKDFEELRGSKPTSDYNIHIISRCREVSQSWLSTIFTTLKSTVSSFPIVWNTKPDLVLCNGPGTGVPICLIAKLFEIIGAHQSEIIFIESICRVTSMSMTGKILYPIASKFYVQWPHLQINYPKSIYLGGRIS